MQKQLFIFDLDGTLANTHALNLHSYLAACQAHGVIANPAILSAGIENGENWQSFLPRATGLTAEDLKAKGIPHTKREVYTASINLAQGIAPTIAILRAVHAAGHHTALATNANRANAQAMLAHLGIAQLFGVCFHQEDLAPAVSGKQTLFQKAIAHFGTPAALTTIFEDSETGLAAAAKCTGVTVLRVGVPPTPSQP